MGFRNLQEKLEKSIGTIGILCPFFSKVHNPLENNNGSFNIYVDRILPFFDPPPPCVDSFYTLSVDKNRHILTPSPHLST